MADMKTKLTEESVFAFLDRVENESRKQDSLSIVELMKEATGEESRMWGTAIIGFGSYHYKYESGREGDFMLVGFSPRKQNLTLYISSDFEQRDALLNRLGKYKTGKGCLYINKLADVDRQVLRELVKQSFDHKRQKNETT